MPPVLLPRGGRGGKLADEWNKFDMPTFSFMVVHFLLHYYYVMVNGGCRLQSFGNIKEINIFEGMQFNRFSEKHVFWHKGSD